MNLQYKIVNSGRLVNVELLSGRTAVVSSPAAYVDEVIDDNQFKLISYEGKVDFKINQELEFKLGVIKSIFNIQSIDKDDTIPGRYYLSCSKVNLTSWFILPLLTSNFNQRREWFGWKTFMINSYLDKDLKKVVLLYRYFPTSYYTEQEARLITHETYIDFNDPNTYSVAYTFHLKEQHYKDVEMFIQGKYSSISDVGKNKIFNFHSSAESRLKQEMKDILTKSDSRKKALEDKLGMKLPDNVDLKSKSDLTKEIYLYDN